MKKLISYITDKQLTAEIVSIFSNAVNTHIKGWQSEIVHINDFLKNGIPTNVEAVATQGILRGTGHLLKEAANKNLDRYYIDHAYFNAGYKDDFWLRISKNKHTINNLKKVSNFRWEKFFSQDNLIMPWRSFSERGNNILIIPPTNAICWYFNESNWEKNILNFLKETLSAEDFKKVKIRAKPNEPIVDTKGIYKGLKENKEAINSPLEDDLNEASIVIAYNSQVALDALLKGIPVIVDKHNCCYSLSFKLSDLKYGLNNPIFENEPKREELCKWLSYCQFKLEEIKSGLAWKTINNFQI